MQGHPAALVTRQTWMKLPSGRNSVLRASFAVSSRIGRWPCRLTPCLSLQMRASCGGQDNQRATCWTCLTGTVPACGCGVCSPPTVKLPKPVAMRCSLPMSSRFFFCIQRSHLEACLFLCLLNPDLPVQSSQGLCAWASAGEGIAHPVEHLLQRGPDPGRVVGQQPPRQVGEAL